MVHRAAPPPDIAAQTLAGLLRDIVASGREPIEAPDISVSSAVHDLRKALKHWRAILRLIAPMIGEEAELMRVEARDLAREIAAARDSRAAQEALADLGDDLPDLSTRSRATIAERLVQIGANAENISLSPVHKARIGEMWTRAGAAIERWPVRNFDRTEAARQLAASYRRVCAAIPEEWSKATRRRCTGFASGWSSIAIRLNSPTRCGRSSCGYGFPRHKGCVIASVPITTS
jgi:hypothetical protein